MNEAKANGIQNDDPLGLDDTFAWMTALDEERGKADQDDMNWWRDTSTILDETVRIKVYDWDADATDTEVMTRRAAIREGHITPTAEEIELLAAEGVVLPVKREAKSAPEVTAPAHTKEKGPTLIDVLEQYGEDLSSITITIPHSNVTIISVISQTPTAIDLLVRTRSGKEITYKTLPTTEVKVEAQ